MSVPVLQKVFEIPWDSYPHPYPSQAAQVPEVLRCVYAAKDAESAEAAGSKLRQTLGNDCRGTYYPVLLAALPFLEDVLRTEGRWSKETALGFLTDLACSFYPEDGYEEVRNANGLRASVSAEFHTWLHNLRPLLSDLALRQDETSEAAQYLIEVIDTKVPTNEQEDTCSFCGQPRSKVGALMAGQGEVAICNQCVAVCYEALRREGVDLRLPQHLLRDENDAGTPG